MSAPAPLPGDDPLKNGKHEAVAAAYLADPQRIGFKAYLAVFPDSSEKAARTAWSRLLKRADFAARIAALKSKAADASVMQLKEVLQELSKIGRSSIKRCVVDGDDTVDVIRSIHGIADPDADAIQELTVETYVEGRGDDAREVKRVKVKLHSKPAALAELRAHYEPTKHEHSGKDGGPIKTEPAGPLSEIDLARRVAFALEKGAALLAAQQAAAAHKEKA